MLTLLRKEGKIVLIMLEEHSNNPPATSTDSQNHSIKVLIVEDEVFIADLYADVLTNLGYQIKIVSDANSAMQALSQDVYDLMLLDIMLPTVNGLGLLRQWRTKKPDSTMKVVLLTNLGQDFIIEEASKLGIQGYLVKSTLTPDQVAQEVKRVLENRQATSNPLKSP